MKPRQRRPTPTGRRRRTGRWTLPETARSSRRRADADGRRARRRRGRGRCCRAGGRRGRGRCSGAGRHDGTRGRRSGARAGRAGRGRGGEWRGARQLPDERSLLGADLHEARARLALADLGDLRVVALRCDDGLHLVGRHVRVLELDRPDRAAGEVDRELEAHLAARDRAEQDEDQARDRDGEGQREEPVALPDQVIHARAPRLAAAGPSRAEPGTRPR